MPHVKGFCRLGPSPNSANSLNHNSHSMARYADPKFELLITIFQVPSFTYEKFLVERRGWHTASRISPEHQPRPCPFLACLALFSLLIPAFIPLLTIELNPARLMAAAALSLACVCEAVKGMTSVVPFGQSNQPPIVYVWVKWMRREEGYLEELIQGLRSAVEGVRERVRGERRDTRRKWQKLRESRALQAACFRDSEKYRKGRTTLLILGKGDYTACQQAEKERFSQLVGLSKPCICLSRDLLLKDAKSTLHAYRRPFGSSSPSPTSIRLSPMSESPSKRLHVTRFVRERMERLVKRSASPALR